MTQWGATLVIKIREREREREREGLIGVCAACSIISVLTQWGATLVIKIRERGPYSGIVLYRGYTEYTAKGVRRCTL